MRLAWFSPWPPQRSGVAGRSAELVSALAARGHAIDVFVDASRVTIERGASEAPAPGRVRVLSAHDFLWRAARGQYDLPVYQIGNSHLHRYIWPYAFRCSGLVVVHDARVHHARAEALLSQHRTSDYRDEFAWCHPDVHADAAELAVLGIDGPFFFQWPMVRGVVETARLVAAHSAGAARLIAGEWPHRPVMLVALGEGPDRPDLEGWRRQFRRAHHLPETAVVFGVHGGLTGEKRVLEVLAAFSATRPWADDARLLLVGTADATLGLEHRIARMGLEDVVHQFPSLAADDFDRSIAACDVTLNLRWPSALETSGPWVRSLAMSRASVILDLPHQGHLPVLDPRTWKRHAPTDDLEAGADARAIAVAIDVADLDHSLRIAMRRLATDAALRDRLGGQARRWWEREHTVARMVGDYEQAIARAASAPAPAASPDWPPHLVPNPAAPIRDWLLQSMWTDPAIADRLASFKV